jgi:AraC-like DNA-binding protein
VRVCLVLPLPLDVPGYSIGETRTLGLIANIICAFVGSSFAPTRVLLASRSGDLHFDLDVAYGGVPVHTDQPYGAIEFPRTLLPSSRPAAQDHLRYPGSTPPANPPVETLACALETCLAPYLLEGYPSVDLAAEIAGLSVRTLQRRLREEGASYMGLIDRVRCEAALSSLRDDTQSLKEIGQRLGYSDQAAFTRAFQRWVGTTPGEYRARAKSGA